MFCLLPRQNQPSASPGPETPCKGGGESSAERRLTFIWGTEASILSFHIHPCEAPYVCAEQVPLAVILVGHGIHKHIVLYKYDQVPVADTYLDLLQAHRFPRRESQIITHTKE